jgi:hypothetical protein
MLSNETAEIPDHVKEAGTVSTVIWPPKIKEFIRMS